MGAISMVYTDVENWLYLKCYEDGGSQIAAINSRVELW